jgi:hypothetical protein
MRKNLSRERIVRHRDSVASLGKKLERPVPAGTAHEECWSPVNPNPVIGKPQVRPKRSLLHVTRNAILFL